MNLISRVSLRPPYRPSPWAGLLVTAVNAGCLWWFTWMQVMAVWMFGFPWFSGGGSSVISLVYYAPAGDLPWSLPEMFLVLSAGLSFLCLTATFRSVRGKAGGSRMMTVVGIFATILMGFSYFINSARLWHVEALDWYIGIEDERGGERYQGRWEEQRRFLQETIDWHRRDMGLD